MASEIALKFSGKTVIGKTTPEKIEIIRLIRKLTGSPCLKYKTKDAAKSPKAKKGKSVIILKAITIKEFIRDNSNSLNWLASKK